MKALLGILGSIGLASSGAVAASLPNLAMTTINSDDNYSSILVDVAQNVSVRSKNSEGEKDASTKEVNFSDLQTELHMDYDTFLKADFTIHAIGNFKVTTHLNPAAWSEIEFIREASSSSETKYIAHVHHEAQNGWAKQKGDITIHFTVRKDNSMWVKTSVSAESYGSVSSCSTLSELNGISFK